MITDDGGSAFPLYCESSDFAQYGMSLRDWFAGQALAGRLASHGSGRGSAEYEATLAYQIADAMLEARRDDRG